MTPTPLYSPRPHRPLKRSNLEVDDVDDVNDDNNDDDDDEYYSQAIKRQRLLPGFEPFIPSTSITTRPTRDVRKRAGYRDDYDDVEIPNSQTSSPAPSPSPTTSFRSPVFSPRISVAESQNSVAESQNAVAESQNAVAESQNSARTRSASVTYREDLLFHGICLEPLEPPIEIIEHAQSVLNRRRDSPTLSAHEINRARKSLRNLRQSADETSINASLVHYKIIPHIDDFPGIEQGSNRQFEKHALPRQNLGPPLSHPKPDNHYSFQVSEFTQSQQVKQNSRSLHPYSAPSSAGRWPFFLIEIKSQAKGGTIWDAENQAAIGGAILTNSLQKLFTIADKGAEQIDTIVFSCTMDARHAAFWVHYVEARTQRYCSVEISDYSMKNSDQIIACRNTMRNIMDWGLTTRLPKILETLEGVSVEDLEADGKAQLGRSASSRALAPQKRRA